MAILGDKNMIEINVVSGHIPQEEIKCQYGTWVFPENSAHPDDLKTFGKDIVKMAKKDGQWTVITHSPIIIDSIDVWVNYLRELGYKIKVTYFLYERKEANLKEIKENKLYEIYENLSQTYRYFNSLRIRTKMLKDE